VSRWRIDPPVLALLAAAACTQGCGGSRDRAPTDGGGVEAPASSADAAEGGETGDATGGPGSDAGSGGDADSAALDAATASRCQITATKATCPSQLTTLGGRPVAYETPLGVAPAGGWPAVVYFQGSLVPGTDAFAATSSAAFDQYDLTRTVAALLDDGYAVIAPDAAGNGSTYWETNIPPYAESWSGCPDDVLMQALLAAIAAGSLGPLDPARLYAMGISSGGFMTSRMAVSYPGQFRALADCSGSYATCSDTCTVPTPLPADHPPTLFLHGGLDTVVPLSAIQPYLDALTTEGHEAQLVTDADAGHQWLPEGPQVIPAWFDSHP
jgi:poly(3-hydroxybutyrate) depolymerase